ncbi:MULTISPECIES: hypothetical protein [unclassified Curtobacterium]|uniref:hypothetical protein n=1 Tax=unclassified Curtobacterium TaxID=257496 RepID=UPI00380AF508
MNLDNTLVQKYAPTLLSAALTVFGGLQVLISSGHGLVPILQFLTLLATTVTTYAVPLVDKRWQGAWKTGLEIFGVLIAAVLPFAIDHTLTWTNALMIVVAAVKALATHFGIALRTDTSIDTTTAEAVVTTVPAGTLAGGDALTDGDGLSDPANAVAPATVTIAADSDEPKHLATS